MPEGDYFGHDRQEMLPYVPTQRARALEIGCGYGRFIGSLPGVVDSWGIEPTGAAEAAQKRLTRVLRGTFDDTEEQLPKGYFDLVICNDVIEHMPDVSNFFTRITKYISPGGMIIGSIPNVRFYNNMFEFLLEKDWRYTDEGILDKTHLAFFTKKSFRRTLEEHDFEVLRLEGINADVRFSRSLRTRLYLIAAYVLVVMTFGYFSDIRYLQFAFQATPRKS
jgi:2-polyprenyl-3-methyl-5-hydroxy-6-metoxy-1,4-benzoquinol methylase